MSKFKQGIRDDIRKCEELIEQGYATDVDVSCLVGKYTMSFPNFDFDLLNYAKSVGSKRNEIDNIRIIKSKLEFLLDNGENMLYNKRPNFGVNVNTNVINENNNKVINMTYNEIENEIKDHTILGENDKKELLQILEELKELVASSKTKNEKWKILRGTLKFLADKGADIAIMFLPKIIEILNS